MISFICSSEWNNSSLWLHIRCTVYHECIFIVQRSKCIFIINKLLLFLLWARLFCRNSTALLYPSVTYSIHLILQFSANFCKYMLYRSIKGLCYWQYFSFVWLCVMSLDQIYLFYCHGHQIDTNIIIFLFVEKIKVEHILKVIWPFLCLFIIYCMSTLLWLNVHENHKFGYLTDENLHLWMSFFFHENFYDQISLFKQKASLFKKLILINRKVIFYFLNQTIKNSWASFHDVSVG